MLTKKLTTPKGKSCMIEIARQSYGREGNDWDGRKRIYPKEAFS